MPDSGGLQLIPQTKRKIEIHRPGQNKFLFISLGVLVIFSALALLSSWYKSSIESKIEEVNLKISEVENESRALAEEKREIKILANQFNTIRSLIDQHIFWSRGLALLEANIRPDVEFVSMNANTTEDKISLNGRASNYSSVARQIAALFREPSIKNVAVSGISASSELGVEFDLLIEFDQKTFFGAR